MKRWAVFEGIDYYPAGGMDDFRAAFDTKEQAEAFIQNTLDTTYYSVEDMRHYLTQPSPPIPTPADKEAAIEERRQQQRRHRRQPVDPVEQAAEKLCRVMAKDMYGDGSET